MCKSWTQTRRWLLWPSLGIQWLKQVKLHEVAEFWFDFSFTFIFTLRHNALETIAESYLLPEPLMEQTLPHPCKETARENKGAYQRRSRAMQQWGEPLTMMKMTTTTSARPLCLLNACSFPHILILCCSLVTNTKSYRSCHDITTSVQSDVRFVGLHECCCFFVRKLEMYSQSTRWRSNLRWSWGSWSCTALSDTGNTEVKVWSTLYERPNSQTNSGTLFYSEMIFMGNSMLMSQCTCKTIVAAIF